MDVLAQLREFRQAAYKYLCRAKDATLLDLMGKVSTHLTPSILDKEPPIKLMKLRSDINRRCSRTKDNCYLFCIVVVEYV
ncbi:hypothetical protein Cylst_6628 (plasmid) [Cylindrospermum stagnale PCC 7417]|uniref:Uncharacterized protein n=1 Tax=Cylindrospermum stagnale PCC 7417 TaxID=56107 RepID=K9X9S0_9NOST|nr:hypothetical protein Cylst_6628 [Cylindrospermum stagnale PCC 7417]